MRTLDTDYLVIGSGIAGLLTAIHLAPRGRVLVVTKTRRDESNTSYAQGGIACAVNAEDSVELHVEDTLVAGDGLCDERVVRAILEAGPERIPDLIAFGLQFAEHEAGDGGGFDLGKEGGHTHRRVLHAGDITGRAIVDVLLERALSDSNISLLEHHMAIDLVTTGWLQLDGENRCVGVYLLNRKTGEILAARAPYVILATGGASKVYLYTSNPDIATGDGVAMAWRAGVPVRNMEMIQFHPTCLYHRDAKSFLISEAVRGEGAELVDAAGNPFMQRYDERGSLAPRDIAARAIDQEMKACGAPCMFLDIRHQPPAFLKRRFPSIYAFCLKCGIDMATDLIPIVPAAHYCCGGVEAEPDGTTRLPGLSVCGETASTGLHGANRLASNSLLEAVVCSWLLAERLKASRPPAEWPCPTIPAWQSGDAAASDEAVVVEHNWNEVRTCMWDYVGIVRTDKRLAGARRRIVNLRSEIREYYLSYLVTDDVLELRNIAAIAELIVRCAQARRESRGLHFTLDCPDRLPEAVDTVVRDPAGGPITD